MAELPYGGAERARSGTQNFSTLTNYAGAVVSLGLMVGVGVWGYGVLSRDVSGVPVVRAASSEPMRVAPETPGGTTAAHQGLSVNEVMAQGGAEKPADRLVLAPAPVNLLDEDQPLADTVVPQTPSPSAAVETMQPEDAEPLTPQMASIRALAEQLADGVAPLAGQAAPEEAPEAVMPVAVEAPVEPVASIADVAAEAASEPALESVVMTSLRPKLRPQVLQASASATVASAVTEAVAAAVSVPAGTRLVQLGAFDSEEVAEREWTRLTARFEEYFEGKSSVVQRAESGGRTFFRLRAMGFADLSDSRRFCAALLAERADCIPVVSK
ncbi:SPOR domain-containing protein [Lentibacter sp.]|uniref:SPOR domain-containing protein n=1 Tax=Lentibacter sp. TaxID=2024994 RepID=UPI003F6D4C7A